MELNSREIALLIWLGVFVIFALIKARDASINLLRSFFAGKLVRIYVAILAYISIVVYGLSILGLWDSSQLKNTILWTITVGFISVLDITNEKKSNYFKETVKDIFKFTTLSEFLIGLYAFHLIFELMLIPLVVFIIGMLAVTKTDKKYSDVAKFLNNTLSFLGLILIGYTIYKMVRHFSVLTSKSTISDFLMPPVLSFLYLPFVYVLSLIVNHQDNFVGIRRAIQNPKLLRYAKWQAVRNFAFNKTDLARWRTYLFANHGTTKTEILASIRQIKQLKKLEKNPPIVPFKSGWSPYQAKDFLIGNGITTGYYKPLYVGKWSCYSPSIEIQDGPVSSSVSYHVEGPNDGSIATRLRLVLNVYHPATAKAPHQRFLDYIKPLWRASLKTHIKKDVEVAIKAGKNLETREGNMIVKVIKEKWINHSFNGYKLEFSISHQDYQFL